jgi:hypothetical protein
MSIVTRGLGSYFIVTNGYGGTFGDSSVTPGGPVNNYLTTLSSFFITQFRKQRVAPFVMQITGEGYVAPVVPTPALKITDYVNKTTAMFITQFRKPRL